MDFRKIILKRAIVEIMKKLVSAVPFLGWPIVNQAVSYLIEKILIKFIDEVEKSGMIIKIDFDTHAQQEAYEREVTELRKILMDTDSKPEEVEKAKDEFNEKFRSLVMLNSN